MGSLIGLKNMLIFSAVLFTIGSVSAQQAFAGAPTCFSINDGNWNNASNWDFCGGAPDATTNARIVDGKNIVITGDEETGFLIVNEGTLFIDCDASLFVNRSNINAPVTNHGTFTSSPFDALVTATFFNSGTISGVVLDDESPGSIVKITSICDRPIGGTVGSLDTATLLVAGVQANMGLWSLALVGIVGAGAAIIYKTKSKKTEQ